MSNINKLNGKLPEIFNFLSIMNSPFPFVAVFILTMPNIGNNIYIFDKSLQLCPSFGMHIIDFI